jgi:phosphatidylglycerophosphate synthase
MNRADTQIILLADAPNALVELCGITLLERLLRILQRLDATHALVISTTPGAIRGELARRSWPREKITVDIATREAGDLAVETLIQNLSDTVQRHLVIPGAIYCDARLLAALYESEAAAVLIDSLVPPTAQSLVKTLPQTARGKLCGPALLTKDSLSMLSSATPFFDQLRDWADNGKIGVVDAATQPDYIVSMRRHLRPLCFPAPLPEQTGLAERLVLNTGQNGTLDLPAYLHAPIETWIISRLCRTRVSPNQITLAGLVFGSAATWAFATGHVALGAIIALIFGLIDGLDGKQARVKIETTPKGKWEHQLDTVIEYSWWIALAYYLSASGQLPSAFYFLALLLGSDLANRESKRRAKIATGRLLDDLTSFDRIFRLVSGRRNVYVWILAGGVLFGVVPRAYIAICLWAGLSAVVHLARWAAISRAHRGLESQIGF